MIRNGISNAMSMRWMQGDLMFEIGNKIDAHIRLNEYLPLIMQIQG